METKRLTDEEKARRKTNREAKHAAHIAAMNAADDAEAAQRKRERIQTYAETARLKKLPEREKRAADMAAARESKRVEREAARAERRASPSFARGHLSNLLRIVTNSERGEFGCKRRWGFRYRDGLATDSAAPLRMGGLWHACLAAWYRSHCTMGLADLVRDVVGPWEESRAAWHQAHPEAQDIAQEDKEAAALTTVMLAGYLAMFSGDAGAFEVLNVEPQLARWLTNPKTGKPMRDRVMLNGKRTFRQWAYGGAMDLLVKMRDGSVWFMEHKTASEKDLQAYCRKLDWDPQIRGYAWAAADPIGTDSPIKAPIRITGVIYNVARKKSPEQPELVTASKKDQEANPSSVITITDKDGKPALRRLSRSAIDTTRDQYMAAIHAHGFNPDNYADTLEQLKRNVFFHREHVVFTDPELDDFGRDAAASAMEIMEAETAGYHPRQQSVCTGIAPRPCPYKELCLNDTPALRKTFVVRGIRHVELTGVLAEDYVAKLRPGYAEPVTKPVEPPRNTPQPDPFTEEPVASHPDSLHTIDPFAEL